MSEYRDNLLESASPIKKQKEEAAKLVTKWEKSGLLEGMDNDWQRSGMATLLENQARQLISENSKTSPLESVTSFFVEVKFAAFFKRSKGLRDFAFGAAISKSWGCMYKPRQ